MKLTANCTICQKPLALASEVKFEDGYLRTYKCGHAFWSNASAPDSEENAGNFAQLNFRAAVNGKEAFDFQKEGVEFIRQSGYNCVVADPMGLGKTIQALLAAREARLEDGLPKFKTILVIVKSATTYQWMAEAKEWYDPSLWSCYIIPNTKAFIPPGFRMYILSMDTMSRMMKQPKGISALQNLNFDLTIVDECHSFKNPDSARSQALVAFLQGISVSEIKREIKLVCNYCQESIRRASLGEPAAERAVAKFGESWNAEWTEEAIIKYDIRTNRSGTLSYRHSTQCPKCESRVAVYQDRIILDERERNKGLIMLSGTPIKNRAEEYFVPLNLLRPDLFTNLASFRKTWLEPDENGKWNRIKSWKLDAFRELTSSFIIRREKTAVLKLPPFRRAFIRINIEDEGFKRSYNAALDSLQERVDELEREGKEMNFFEVQTHLFTLRRIVGMAKVQSGIDYAEDFLESVEGEKLAIGVQHNGVRDTLYNALTARGTKCLKLSGEDSAERKHEILQEFNRDPEIRVIVINMAAGGVGLNIQAANNTLVLERQWNAADEEQFEARFWRHGQNLPVLAEYMIAAGVPIEDYFTELVEYKRKTCGETLDGWDFSNDNGAVQEMVYKSLHSRL